MIIGLIKKISTLACLIGLTYIALWAVPPRTDLVYASVLDKHMLLASCPSPRVIFVGGSGIALGLDSRLIEERLQIPVINMGVNAGFGLHYMLDEVKPYIRAGDVIIIVPEYEHFYGTLFEGDQNLLWALRFRPKALRDVSRTQLLLLLPDIPSFMQDRLREIIHRLPDPIYNRWGFNEHGDFVNHLRLPPTPLELYSIRSSHALNLQAVDELAQFVHRVDATGATAYLLYPAIAESFWHYHDNQQTVTELHRLLTQSQIINVPAVPRDYVLPKHLFFDTVYHLTDRGRQLRSEQIAEQMQQLLPTVSYMHDCQ